MVCGIRRSESIGSERRSSYGSVMASYDIVSVPFEVVVRGNLIHYTLKRTPSRHP